MIRTGSTSALTKEVLMPNTRAEKLRALAAQDKRTADAAQKARLRSEDAVNALEDREARRDARAPVPERKF